MGALLGRGAGAAWRGAGCLPKLVCACAAGGRPLAGVPCREGAGAGARAAPRPPRACLCHAGLPPPARSPQGPWDRGGGRARGPLPARTSRAACRACRLGRPHGRPGPAAAAAAANESHQIRRAATRLGAPCARTSAHTSRSPRGTPPPSVGAAARLRPRAGPEARAPRMPRSGGHGCSSGGRARRRARAVRGAFLCPLACLFVSSSEIRDPSESCVIRSRAAA